MCEECRALEKKIEHYRQFLAQPFDPLTTERIKTAITDLEKQKDAMHS